jgi:hypothetical protein
MPCGPPPRCFQHPLIGGTRRFSLLHKTPLQTAAAGSPQVGEGVEGTAARVREKPYEAAEMEVFRLLVAFLVLVASPAEAARAPLRIQPLPTAALRRLYDSSNYGSLQLNNGLALTPQMG